MPDNDHPRTRLNNALQPKYGATVQDHVRWEVYSQGPLNATTWYATIYIDDLNYGHASASTRSAAQDAAAQQAYETLKGEGST
ncbi:uncharacterized protein BJ212DRAFT_1482664 [Suillus subaureus]|uniref:DRBM domain-containing protein n=1 Tax=Suillus subaureus TaxID=48587 RepID=A0A9P7E7J6_9AGAM|nr:uncharacterized protein BJ212DRAFT_1482664 [Suillus subaureus]KAG1813194.1 hypothetical protein BJ212DRAFT_1482664 [Suillus subaureus]